MRHIPPRLRIPVARFPPIPFTSRRLSANDAERRMIRAALALGPPRLPTDLPDLLALVASCESALMASGAGSAALVASGVGQKEDAA